MADECYSNPIDISSSTILITGGSSGIGLGLAQYFVRAGASVIITGRREQQLKEAVEKLNQIGNKKAIYRINDVEKLDERLALYNWIITEHPQTNILINNAGIQQRHPFIPNDEDSSKNISWEEREKEIQINICAPMHLSYLFLTHFSSNENNFSYYECFIRFRIYTISNNTNLFSNKSCITFIYNESSLSINE